MAEASVSESSGHHFRAEAKLVNNTMAASETAMKRNDGLMKAVPSVEVVGDAE